MNILNCLAINDLLLSMNRHEAKFIQEIIKDVLTKLDPKYLYVPKHLVGIDPLVNEIRDFISNATENVCIVGIHGMPGIGKTTIAKEVFNKLCDEFEGSFFLLNVKEKSESKDMVLLQQQLLHDILRQNAEKINNVDRGKVLIKERLCRKRVLIVVDDVDHLDQLNALMGERSWFGPGSRVIITTRDERLLLEADQRYQVQELHWGDSLQLFCQHAFRDTKPAKDYVGLSNDVVEYCGGLPLALEVLGSCLYGKNQARWESVINRLRKFPNCEIKKKLRISFDTLDEPTLKNTFLDIACFFIGRQKEYVAKVLEGRYGYNPEDDWGILIERSLIKVDDSGTISMHDLLREMGREIVKEESPENPAQRSRIWSQEDAWKVLKMQMVRTQRIQKSTFMCIFIVKLLTNNHMKVRLIFILFFAFLGNRSCKWPYTGCEKIRRQITKHRIIYKNEKLKITANQWSRPHRIFRTAF